MTSSANETQNWRDKMAKFNKGDKVKDCFGKVHTVISAYGCDVLTTGGNFHPTKLFAV
jgi:hypothetical protein